MIKLVGTEANNVQVIVILTDDNLSASNNFIAEKLFSINTAMNFKLLMSEATIKSLLIRKKNSFDGKSLINCKMLLYCSYGVSF